jgi:hypothetical protein
MRVMIVTAYTNSACEIRVFYRRGEACLARTNTAFLNRMGISADNRLVDKSLI